MHKQLLESTIKVSLFYLVVVMCGCSKVESKNVITASMTSNTEVTAGDEKTIVSTKLRKGVGFEGSAIKLSSGDRLLATLDGNTIILAAVGDRGKHEGEFTSSEGGVELKVALIRDNGTNAPNSKVKLPLRFNIDAPNSGEEYRTGDSITTVWSPPDPENLITITYTYNCKPESEENSLLDDVASYVVTDTGSHTTTVTDILNARGPQTIINGEPCPVELKIGRSNNGVLDSEFEGGGVVANRSKVINITIVP